MGTGSGRRALGALAVAVAGFALLGPATPAYAEDPPPTVKRAVPVPRAPERAPSASLGYEALERHAFAVAADLTALDQAAGAVADERSAILAQLGELDAVTRRPLASRDRLERAVLRLATASSVNPTALPDLERETADAVRVLRARLLERLDALGVEAAALAAAGAGRAARPSAVWVTPTQGRTTQPFGPTRLRLEPARTYGGVFYRNFHDGIDIGAPRGTPVVAAAPGLVTFAGRMGDGAWIVLIAHVDGFVTLYAHLDPRLVVAAGDYVAAGQPVGAVGSTGVSTGPHVQFSVWQDGGLIDPMTRLRG